MCPVAPTPIMSLHGKQIKIRASEFVETTARSASAWGTWCSGITSASHAEGPGFKSQCVHFAVVLRNKMRCRRNKSSTRHRRFSNVENLAMTGNYHRFKPGRQTITRATLGETNEERNAAEKKRIWKEAEPTENNRTSERAPSQRKRQNTHRGARTHDHKVKGLALCRLS